MNGRLPINNGCLCFALIDGSGVDRVMRVLADGTDLAALEQVKTALTADAQR